jgi:hypothetical protein
MENSRRKNYWIDVLLFVLMLAAFFSLNGSNERAPGEQSVAHCIAGLSMFALVIRHVVSHMDWIKKVYTIRRKDLPRKLRIRRRNDLWLFIWFVPCCISGFIIWTFGYNEAISRLHKVTGMLSFATMLLHVAYHMRWIVNTTKRHILNIGRKTAQEQPLGADSSTSK